MLMESQIQYKIFAFVLELRRSIQRHQSIRYSIQIIQFLWIMVSIIANLKSNIFSQTQPLEEVRTFALKHLTNQSLLQACYWTEICFTIIIICSAVIYVRILPKLFAISKKKIIIKAIIFMASFSLWISQILIYPAIYKIFNYDQEKENEQIFLKGFILTFVYILSMRPISNYALFHNSTFILAVALSNNNHNETKMFVSVIIFVYHFLKAQSKLTRAFSSFGIVSFTSNIFLEIVGVNLGLEKDLLPLYAIILIALLIVYILKFSKYLEAEESLNSFEKILERVRELKTTQNLADKLSLKQLIEINRFILTNAQKSCPKLYLKLSNRVNLESTVRSVYENSEQILLQMMNTQKLQVQKLLVIECMMRMGKSLSSIYHFINLHQINIEKISFQHKTKYIQVIENLRLSYGMFKLDNNQQLQVAVIQQIDKVISQFRENTQQMMINQIQFWQIFLDTTINPKEVFHAYTQLDTLRKEIKKNKRILVKLKLFHRFRSIYKCCQKSFRQYDSQSHAEDEEVQTQQSEIFKPWEKQSSSLEQNQQISDKFFVVSDSQILKISHSLATQIKIKQNDLDYLQITDLLGADSSDYLKEKIDYMNPKNQHEWFQLPFFLGKYKFIAFKARILWVPTLKGTGTYLIEVVSVPNTSFLYYNMQTDDICYFSDHFIEEFGVCQNVLTELIDSGQLKYEVIFLYSFNTSFSNTTCQMSKKYKQRQKSYVPLEMRLDRVLEYGSPKLQSYVKKKVFGKGYDYICMANQMFTIMEIKSFRIDSFKELANESTGTIMVYQSEGTDKIQRFEEEKFFCKIPNSFLGKITQKVVSLKSLRRAKGWMWLWILGGIFSCFWIGENFYTYETHSEKTQLYQKVWNSLADNYEKYIILLDLYATSSKVYHGTKYPENVKTIDNRPYQEYIAEQKQYQSSRLKEFLRIYLPSINENTYHQMSYKVDFGSFQVTGSTGSTWLMDFVTGFKKNVDENEWDFLLTNFGNFRDVTNMFQGAIDYKAGILSQTYRSKMLCVVYLCAVGLLILLIMMVSYRNESNIKKILSVYSRIEDYEIETKVNQLRKDLSIFFYTEANKNPDRQSANAQANSRLKIQASLKNLDYSQGPTTFQRSSFLKRLNNSSTSPRRGKLHTYMFGYPVELGKSDKKIAESQAKYQKIDDKQKQIAQPWLKSRVKYVYPLLAFAVACGFLIGEMISIEEQESKYIKLLEFEKQMLDSRMNLYQLVSDTYVGSVYRDYYGRQMPVADKPGVKMNLRFETDGLFQDIMQISKKIDTLLQGNLCLSMNNLEESSYFNQCNSVAQGRLTEGYSQIFLQLQEISAKIQTYQLQALDIGHCTPDHCPLNQEFQYIGEVLSRTLQNALNVSSDLFFELMKLNLAYRHQQLLLKLIIGFVLMVGLVVYGNEEKKKGEKTVSLFKYFPKTVASTIRMSKFMQREGVLETLEKV